MKNNIPKNKRKKKGSHNKDVPSKTFYYKGSCICCGTKLIRVSSTDRYLSSGKERMRLFVEVYECQNKKCKLHGQKIKPPAFTNLIFPGLSYGIDIVADIGVMRFRENKTIAEIHEYITAKYPHIEMTARHMQNVVNKIMYAIESVALDPKIMKERLLEKRNNIKGLVISVDGLQPERGNEILYIVREVQTGEIIFSVFLEFSDEENIKGKIYKPLKKLSEEMGLPILGLIADKQLVLTTAFQSVFPSIPIQHCQSHFLKAIRVPVQEKSSAMAKDIKKNSEYVK